MKWLVGSLFVGGCMLIWLGNRALNEPNQSADVRVGGLIPIVLGGGVIVLDIIIAFVWLVVRA